MRIHIPTAMAVPPTSLPGHLSWTSLPRMKVHEGRSCSLAPRAALTATRSPTAPAAWRRIFSASIPLPREARRSPAYIAIGDEADPAPLIEAVARAAVASRLPRVARQGQPLAFHLYEAGTRKLVPGCSACLSRRPDWPEVDPDILARAAPCFRRRRQPDRLWRRIHDRSLDAPARTPQSARSWRMLSPDRKFPTVPHHDSDEALDWIVTEERRA